MREVKRAMITRTPTRAYIPIIVVSPEIAYDVGRAVPYGKVHYEMPRYIYAFPPLPGLAPMLKKVDPLLGEIGLSAVEIPGFKFSIPAGPLGMLPLPGIRAFKSPGYQFIPTGETKKMVVDVETELTGVGVKLAVLDTGAPPPWHPQFLLRLVKMFTTVPEPPIDMQGHGSWCSSCAAGGPSSSRFGNVEGVAPAADLIHVKCLSTAGFGSTVSVLKAIETAWRAGAKVVSMSLGGPLQGSVDEDPECVMIKELTENYGMIFVVAAGNEGPAEWTVGSPGASPHALTIGSYSPLYGGTSIFSSRGPSAQFYKEYPDIWNRDYSKYGNGLLKPDCVAPGGGPVKDEKPVDLIYSGSTGWFDGFYDMLVDLFEGMRGTSMATPHVAGLVSLLCEANPEITVTDIKNKMKWRKRGKSTSEGYGPIKLSWFV